MARWYGFIRDGQLLSLTTENADNLRDFGEIDINNYRWDNETQQLVEKPQEVILSLSEKVLQDAEFTRLPISSKIREDLRNIIRKHTKGE